MSLENNVKTSMNLNRYFDHTLLQSDSTKNDIKKLCAEAMEYGFYAVCVHSSYVPLAVEALLGSDVKVVTVVGFPLGAVSTEVKAYETDWACEHGAQEIDMVIHIGALKEGRFEYVKNDIATVVAFADEYDAIVKVILEAGNLSDEEIIKACQLSMEAGAAFVKTSTGFHITGATADHIKLMRSVVGSNMKIKASGGIRDYKTAKKMIEAGADRIGASASIAIMQEANKLV